jgi:hypothetical protein
MRLLVSLYSSLLLINCTPASAFARSSRSYRPPARSFVLAMSSPASSSANGLPPPPASSSATDKAASAAADKAAPAAAADAAQKALRVVMKGGQEEQAAGQCCNRVNGYIAAFCFAAFSSCLQIRHAPSAAEKWFEHNLLWLHSALQYDTSCRGLLRLVLL